MHQVRFLTVSRCEQCMVPVFFFTTGMILKTLKHFLPDSYNHSIHTYECSLITKSLYWLMLRSIDWFKILSLSVCKTTSPIIKPTIIKPMLQDLLKTQHWVCMALGFFFHISIHTCVYIYIYIYSSNECGRWLLIFIFYTQ